MRKFLSVVLAFALSALLALALTSCGESSESKQCREELEQYLLKGQDYYYVNPVNTYPAVYLQFKEGEKKLVRVEFASYGNASAYDEINYTVSGESLGVIKAGKYEYSVGQRDSTDKAISLLRTDKGDAGSDKGAILQKVPNSTGSTSSASNSSSSSGSTSKNGSPNSSSSTPKDTSSSGSTQSVKKDEKITEIDGKTVWKVQAASSKIHFKGSYTGSGNFIVQLQDDNQNLEELVCNEIGDHKLDKSVSVTKGKTYYIQVECSRGTWTVNWTGTGGN